MKNWDSGAGTEHRRQQSGRRQQFLPSAPCRHPPSPGSPALSPGFTKFLGSTAYASPKRLSPLTGYPKFLCSTLNLDADLNVEEVAGLTARDATGARSSPGCPLTSGPLDRK